MKKLRNGLFVFALLFTMIFFKPVTASAKELSNEDFTDISISITDKDGPALQMGSRIKAPADAFDVTCTDTNGYLWEIVPGSSYWKDMTGYRLSTSDTASCCLINLHLCLVPVLKDEDTGFTDGCFTSENIKSISMNGYELDTQYKPDGSGTAILIDVTYVYIDMQGETSTGFYIAGQEASVIASEVNGSHFCGWSGTYYIDGVTKSIEFADASAPKTTFVVPTSTLIISIKQSLEEHTAPVAALAPATTAKDGKLVYSCGTCKKTLSKTTVPRIASIKLSATSCTYNGNVRTPSVTVKDRTGKVLVKNTDYTVKYGAGRKNVGKYAVKVTFKGKYSGEKLLYFKINPKGTYFTRKLSGSKKFAVRWAKQATQTTGYQIQYSRYSNFSGAKTLTIRNNTTVTQKISGLLGNKKYYVRIRTYYKSGSAVYYSGWSKTISVVTKP